MNCENNNENREYLGKILAMFKRMENVVVVNKKTRFNNSELRLLSEILLAKAEGKRYISTQLATRLNVTRSAISQIVNKLEGEGVIKRTPKSKDNKIAYVELTDGALEAYEAEIAVAAEFAGRVVKKFGVAKMEKLLALSDEFAKTVSEVRGK